jgi:hypothetical protein
METMTIEEMEAMVGTEFKYVFRNYDEAWAVIAAFDQNVGFTCLATDTETMRGRDMSDDADKNGNICLVGDSPKMNSSFIKDTSYDMKTIRATGYLKVGNDGGFGNRGGGGFASCNF